MAKQKKHRRPLPFDPFGKWERIPVENPLFWRTLTNDAEAPTSIWVNKVYQVLLYRDYVDAPGWPKMHWLSIKRHDKNPIRDWRDIQRIKNDLIGQANEGMELYPAESRLVDTSNQFHLYVIADPTTHFPFGFEERAIAEGMKGGTNRPRQRPWPVGLQPADAMSAEEYSLACEQNMTDAKGKAGCPTCGAEPGRPHVCGAARDKDKNVVRFPIYTDKPKLADSDAPAAS